MNDVSDAFVVNFEHILHLFSSVSIVDFELVNACLVIVTFPMNQFIVIFLIILKILD